MRWTTGTGSNEFYAYDASGNRVLRRSTSSGTTTMTVYAFGLEEHLYSGNGTSQGNTYYYSLAGRLVGELTGTTPKTNIFLTDPLGSVLATFSNTAGTAALLGNQVYGPYGTQRYSSGGTMGTNKGFTGQYSDSLTGLDYYNARYYDPVVGVFLAVDTVEGNLQGMNPYAYVGGNPETKNDPTGNVVVCPDSCGGSGSPPPPPGGGGGSGGASGGSGSGGASGGGNCHGGTRTCTLPGPLPRKDPIWKPRFGDAQNAAGTAAWRFGWAGGIGVVLSLILHHIAVTLAALTLPEDVSAWLTALGLSLDVIALHLEALAVAAVVLGIEAGILASAFALEVSYSKDDWWSNRSLVTGFFNNINGAITVVYSAALTISTGLYWFSKFVPSWVVKLIGGGLWLSTLGVATGNVLYAGWSEQAEHDELHAMFGD